MEAFVVGVGGPLPGLLAARQACTPATRTVNVRPRRRSRAALSFPIAAKAGEPSSSASSNKSPKDMVAKYGSAFVLTSIAMSAVSLPTWYFVVRSGVDVQGLLVTLADALEGTPIGRPAILDSIPNEIGTFGLAYIAHKASSPIRFPIVLAVTAWLAKKLGTDQEATE